MLFDMEIPKSKNSTIWNLVFTLPLWIMLKLRKLSLKRDTTIAKTLSQLKHLEEFKQLRFTLQKKYLVLHSLVQTRDIFLEVKLALNLEY